MGWAGVVCVYVGGRQYGRGVFTCTHDIISFQPGPVWSLSGRFMVTFVCGAAIASYSQVT